jgi:hypothetical protein
MVSPKKSKDDSQEIKVPEEPKKEPDVIKIVYVYVPLPKEYDDDPFLRCEQVMLIMSWGKQKTYDNIKLMKHYDEGDESRCIRVRRSWLNKWIKDHTVDPSD